MNWYKKSQQTEFPNMPREETDEYRDDRAAEEYMERAYNERYNILREFQDARKKRKAK